MTSPLERIALIRSITGSARGRESDALAEIIAIADGASLDDVAEM